MTEPLFELDPATLSRVDQLHARGSENLAFIIARAQEAKEAGWDYPAISALLAFKLAEDCPNMERVDLCLLVGVATAKLLHIAHIAEDAKRELFKQ